MKVLSVLTVLQYYFLETFGFPAALQCLGKRQGGHVLFKVSPDITQQIQDCDTEWLVNKTVMAYWESNGNKKRTFPILNVTANTALMSVDSDEVKYILECPYININRKLLCSYPPLDTLLEQNQYGFPDWGIIVAVIAGIVLLIVVLSLLFHKVVRKRTIPLEQHGVKCLAQGHTGGGCWDRTSNLLIRPLDHHLSICPN